jgi:universal stress protein E
MIAVGAANAATPFATIKIARLARALGAELELFHCVYKPSIARRGRTGMRGIEKEILDLVGESRVWLESLAKPLRAEGLKVHTAARWDEPTNEGIVRQAMRHKPDLLVAQSARRGRVARLMLSQTDYRLIETCPCPLLLIKTARPYGNGPIVAAIDPTHARDKPAALDSSILDAACALSRRLSVPLHAVHVCTPWEQMMTESKELRRIPFLLKPEIHKMYLQCTDVQVRELAGRHGVTGAQVYVVEGEASKALTAFSRRVSADVVVMGAVSRSAIKRVVIGHTAERVLDLLDADLLIVKAPSFRSSVMPQSIHRLPSGRAPRAKVIF